MHACDELHTCINMLSLPLTRICFNISTVYNDALVAKACMCAEGMHACDDVMQYIITCMQRWHAWIITCMQHWHAYYIRLVYFVASFVVS